MKNPHLPLIPTISALTTKLESVTLALKAQVWEGREMTLACFSEQMMAN